jgi:hypothetical protein
MKITPSPHCGEDLILWPDSTNCLREQLWEMTHMSDDYEVIPYNSDRWTEEVLR